MQDDQRIIYLWQETLDQAFAENATDIHIEAHENFTHIRFRIDGYLRLFRQINSSFHEHLCAHIKVLAQLDIAEKRLPQDGRLQFQPKQRNVRPKSIQELGAVDCRISTLPTLHGEKIVVRLLTSQTDQLDLEQLGFSENQLQTVQASLEAPQGLILVTGPTGSGKTLTLYTFLNQLNDGSRNISTVEDPPEILLPGINQVAINEKSGLDFAKSLRALLRQDPDVIMIGEIRDAITAKTALHAAQTGHLVLGTLHTNDTCSTISRLAHLGCAYDVLAQCLLVITAQRLVRKTCTFCYSQGENCTICKNTGFNGRIAVHEVLEVTSALRFAIEEAASTSTILELARQNGMLTLFEQGQHIVRQGLTSHVEMNHQLGNCA